MTIIGLDPSLTGTAVVIWRDGADKPAVHRLSSPPSGKGVRERIARFTKLAADVSGLLCDEQCAVFIEGYGFCATGDAVHSLAEYGGILRLGLIGHETLIEVGTGLLKKFATGKGNSKKDEVMANVAHRWGELFSTSDEADAYVLCRIGRAYMGIDECANQAQREVIDVLRNGKPKKAKRNKQQAG